MFSKNRFVPWWQHFSMLMPNTKLRMVGILLNLLIVIVFRLIFFVEGRDGSFVLVSMIVSELKLMLVAKVWEKFPVNEILSLKFTHSPQNSLIRFVNFHNLCNLLYGIIRNTIIKHIHYDSNQNKFPSKPSTLKIMLVFFSNYQ